MQPPREGRRRVRPLAGGGTPQHLKGLVYCRAGARRGRKRSEALYYERHPIPRAENWGRLLLDIKQGNIQRGRNSREGVQRD